MNLEEKKKNEKEIEENKAEGPLTPPARGFAKGHSRCELSPTHFALVGYREQWHAHSGIRIVLKLQFFLILFLLENKRVEDEIVILYDINNGHEGIEQFLKEKLILRELRIRILLLEVLQKDKLLMLQYKVARQILLS